MFDLFSFLERNLFFQLIVCFIGWYVVIGNFKSYKDSSSILYKIGNNKIVKIIVSVVLDVLLVAFLQTYCFK